MAGKLKRRAFRLMAVSQDLAGKALKRARPIPLPLSAQQVGAGVTGRTVVITGGTRGVGRTIAEGFAQQGARVAILGRSDARAAKAAQDIGSGAIGLAADVTDAQSLGQAFDRIVQAFGRIDLLISCAGESGPVDTPAWDISAKTFDQVMAVNATGVFAASAEAIRRMRSDGRGGRIINVSSGAVDRAMPGMGPYTASKFALEGLTRQLAADTGAEGIAVCTIRLGGVNTGMAARVMGRIRASLLPDAASVIPAFQAVAAAPAAQVNGRSFAGWRLLADPVAELNAPGPMTAARPFAYPSYTHNGRAVTRGDPDFRIYDRAENQYGPSPLVAERLTQSLATRPMAVYPDEAHGALKSALAARFSLTPDHFAIGNGSWELLDRLLEIFTQPGDEVICGKPGWFGFNMLCGKRALVPVKIPMRRIDGRLEHDLDAVAAAVTPATRLVYLISPSNPEGIILRRAPLLALLDRLPPGLPVLLDEAYFEFNTDPDAISARDLLQRDERIIFGLRTFSKFYALASMRVGYAYGRPGHIDLLNRGERIFNISHLSETAALAALEDEAHQVLVREGTIGERRRIQTRLGEMGLDHIPSEAPYILAELPGDLGAVVERFAQDGIFVGGKSFYKGKYMLFPISTPPENDRNLAIYESCLRNR